MSFLEFNLSLLEENHPGFREDLLAKNPEILAMELETSREGGPTAKVQGVYIHSKHAPLKEAARLIERELTGQADVIIIAGFGFGYLVEACLTRYPLKPVIIVEPDPSFFLTALSVRDLRFVLSSPRISLMIGVQPSAITRLLDLMPGGNIQLIKLRSMYEKDRDYYRQLEQNISAYLSRKEINHNTLKRFGKLWVKNLSRNIDYLAHTGGILDLKDSFRELPALLLAAGPSLDAVLPHLAELKKRFVLVAVDTSFRACVNAGVRPDFLVIVDPQYWNTRHLDGFELGDTILISESSTHPRVFRMLKGDIYFCTSLFPLGKYLEDTLGTKGKLGAGGSVSTSAWDFARFLGCSPIYCAGLDLSFPDLQTHYKGSFFEERTHWLSDRMTPGETHGFHALYDAMPFKVEANKDGRTLTDQRLIVYKWWFEGQMNRFPETHTGNLSPHGIRIEGMPYEDLKPLLDTNEIREHINLVIDGIKMINREEEELREERLPVVKEALENLLKELEELERVSLKALDTIEKIRLHHRQKKDTAPFFMELDEFDFQISNSTSKNIVGFILQGEIHDLTAAGNDDTAGFEEVLQNSARLYGALQRASSLHKELLSDALSRSVKQR